MVGFRREKISVREWDQPIARLDHYDPCEIDPPGYMLVRIGAAVVIVLALLLAADHLFKLIH